MSTRTSTLSGPSNAAAKSAAVRELSPSSPNQTKPMESMKLLYQADQQLKFLHLQAEVDTLLIELQALKQQRPDDLRPVVAKALVK